MRMKMALGVVGALTLLAGTATFAVPTQDRPGIMTQARVFVENRSRAEAVPVSLQEVASDRPLKVQLVSQPWEYRTMTVRSGEDPAPALTTLGGQGWETTGIQLVSKDVVALVLKRPIQR